MAYQNVAPISDIKYIHKSVANYLQDNRAKFYMLLNNGQRYYTLFFWKHKDRKGEKVNKLASEITDIVTELGPVKDIVKNEINGALEFWVDYKGEPTIFVLFDYTRGVVEID